MTDLIQRVVLYLVAAAFVLFIFTMMNAWFDLEWSWPTEWEPANRAAATISALALALPALCLDRILDL